MANERNARWIVNGKIYYDKDQMNVDIFANNLEVVNEKRIPTPKTGGVTYIVETIEKNKPLIILS